MLICFITGTVCMRVSVIFSHNALGDASTAFFSLGSTADGFILHNRMGLAISATER